MSNFILKNITLLIITMATSQQSNFDKAVETADNMWNNIKKRVKDDPEFVKMGDKEKIEIYQCPEFKDFYINNPIVCRYMICMGQFSMKAFKRFLTKCEKLSDPSNTHNKKYDKNNSNEDRWVMRQADYIRYLWESYQKQHFKREESKAIWQHAYESLTNEFRDFKKMHSEIEEHLKTENKNNKSELVRELVSRIANDEQKIDSISEIDLLNTLKDKLYDQRKRNMLKQINNCVPIISPILITKVPQRKN